MPSLTERINQQEEKLRLLKARQQKHLAQKRALEAKKVRSEDTRRKILIGSMFLARMEHDPGSRDAILSQLQNWLTREDDRALFFFTNKQSVEQTVALDETKVRLDA